MINENIAKETLELLINNTESFRDLFFVENLLADYKREYDFDLNMYQDRFRRKWIKLKGVC